MTEETSIATSEPAAGQIEENKVDVEANETSTEPAVNEEKQESKPEKTPEQREIERLRRGIDRRTRQLSEARAQLNYSSNNAPKQSQDDSEPLSLTRAQIQEMVTAEARKLAPTLQEQATELEHRKSVVDSLTKTWGKERFEEVSQELDEAFGGLSDASGRPKPATEAIFECDSPAKVIEYLADPENEDEAERISRMDAVRAGIAIAKLEARISEKSKPTQKTSKAPPPIESLKGKGVKSNDLHDELSADEWLARRNKQLRSKFN